MNWKTLACLVLVAGFAAGCSSSSSRSPTWSSNRDKGSTPVAGMERASSDRDWEDMRVGMSERQVRAELGAPDRVTDYRDGTENWYYRDGGVVYFTPRSRVADWRAPQYAYRTYMARDGRIYRNGYYDRDGYIVRESGPSYYTSDRYARDYYYREYSY